MSNPNIAEASAQPHKNTRFKLGNTASKGKGRPRSKFISDALKYRLENGAADEIGDQLTELAKKAKQPSVRVRAAEVIRDSTEGRPKQQIDLRTEIDGEVCRVIAELASKLL